MTDTTIADVPATETELVSETIETEVAAETESAEKPEGETEQAPKKEKEPWPKSAENAVDRHKRDKRQLKAVNRQLEQRIKELEASSAKGGNEPDPKHFENYTDYMEARQDFKVNRVKDEMTASSEINALKAQQQQMQAQKLSYVAEVAKETAKDLPDLGQVVGQYGDVIEQADPAIQEIITDLDNPSLAIYTLAKMGRLENVLNTTPALAAQYLAQAELLGQQFINEQRAKRVTKAPDPMRGAKGVSGATKSADRMSGDELLKHYKLKS